MEVACGSDKQLPKEENAEVNHFAQNELLYTNNGNERCQTNTTSGEGSAVESMSDREISENCVVGGATGDLSQQKPVGIRPQVLVEVAIQVNDYDIERRSGRLPARRRVIPFKFRDYKNPDLSQDDSSDSDYEPETEVRLPRKRNTGQKGPGRPRKQVPKEEVVEDTNGESLKNKEEKPSEKNPKPVVIKTAKGFKCGLCSKVFTQKGNLVVHHRIHTGVKPYSCDFQGCSKSFRSNESLRRHKLAHLGIKPYECNVCGSKFSSSLARQEHMARHSDEKPLQCQVCQRFFRQISCLRRHQITHTQDMPFECEVCLRRFSQKTYLRSHMKVHTGEKPYVCPQCDKAFAHQSDLARHKIIHTGEKPYECEICPARFSDASSRRRHVREHFGNKPFSCSLCEETFKRAGQLRAHLGRKHTYSKDEIHIVKHGNKYKQIALSGNGEGNIDWMSPENQKKILDLIKKMNPNDPNIVVQQVAVPPTVTSPDDQKQTVLEVNDSDLQITLAEHQGQVLQEELEESDVPVEKTVIAITGNGDAAGSIPVEAFEIIQGLAEDSGSQQVFEVHYQSEVSMLNETEVRDPQVSQLIDTADSVLIQHCSDIENQSQTEENLDYKAERNVKSPPCTTSAETEYPGEESQSSESHQLPQQPEQQDTAAEILQPQTIDYVANPDFSSQEYFNWLSSFTELGKVLPIPLEKSVFQKISQVHKTLSDFMATPSGVISDKENFRVLMCISKDLNNIINEHLSFILQSMDDEDH